MNKSPVGITEKTFFRLLPVQIIMIAINGINSIIDSAVASNFIGSGALAATGLFFPINQLLNAANIVLLGGSQILCGRYLGKNQVHRSSEIFSLDMISVAAFSLLITLLCSVFSRPIAGLFAGSGKTLSDDLSSYMRGYAFGIFPCLLTPQLTAFMQMEHQDKRTYIGMIGMIVSNIALDFLFVKTLDMGIFGLGLATAVSLYIFAAILLTYYIFGDPVIRFSLKGLSLSPIKEIIGIGLPGALGILCMSLRSIILNFIILKFIGQTGMSAFTAVNSFGTFFFALPNAANSSARMLASVYLGEEDRTSLVTLMKTSLFKCVGLIAGLAVVFSLLSGPFTLFFCTPDAGELYQMIRTGFTLFPILLPISAFYIIFSSYYQCRGRMKIVNALSIMDGVAYISLFSLILAPFIGLTGVWIAHIVSDVLTALFPILYAWRRNRAFPKTAEELILLEPEFGVVEENRIDLTIDNMSEVINLSEKVIVFAKDHGIDAGRSFYAGLCVEEMAGNIVEHGFFKDRKKHRVDVRVIYKEDGLLIRLKDDCRAFNPKEIQDLFDPADITHNIGLRMIARLTKQMDYQNSFGLNVLSIRL